MANYGVKLESRGSGSEKRLGLTEVWRKVFVNQSDSRVEVDRGLALHSRKVWQHSTLVYGCCQHCCFDIDRVYTMLVLLKRRRQASRGLVTQDRTANNATFSCRS